MRSTQSDKNTIAIRANLERERVRIEDAAAALVKCLNQLNGAVKNAADARHIALRLTEALMFCGTLQQNLALAMVQAWNEI